MATSSPSCNGHTRSRSTPLTFAITAALRRFLPIAAARSPAVVPAATSRVDPSGSRTVIWSLMRSRLLGCPDGLLRIQHVGGRPARLLAAVRGRDLRRFGGERLGLLRGVRVDVLLSRELADGEHDLVDHLPQREVVVAPFAVPVRADRRAEADLARLERLRQLGLGRLDVTGADDADRHDGCAGAHGEARRSGVALVEDAVARARALGVDAEQ